MKLCLICSTVLILLGVTVVANSLEVMAQSEEELKKYDNKKLGISFLYPTEWNDPLDLTPFCKIPDEVTCGLQFLIFEWQTPNTTAGAWWKSNKSTFDPSVETDRKMLEVSSEKKIARSYGIGVDIFELDKPSVNAGPCNCNTLKDFVAWDYTRTENVNRTFVNDNQTLIGKNYTGWQTETDNSGSGTKKLSLYMINGKIGYKFVYNGPSRIGFEKYIDGFKNMLKTVAVTPPIPEKRPSFLNSSNISNSPPSAIQEKSVKILSSNDFIDSIGYLHVVGEIENNTPQNLAFVKVTGTFYDSNNQVVATDFTYTNPSNIGPEQKAPFELTLLSASIPVSQIDHYNLVASYD